MRVTIIVPIYNAADALKKCIDSLQQHNSNDEVIFINDCSTDPEVSNTLSHLSNSKWRVLSNSKNLGFVKTANIGLKLSDANSILLNSDTIVTKNWLKGFIQALHQCENLGTATPWSNNAEICSFPLPLKNNKIIDEYNALSQILYQQHIAEYPKIPTAVGFCMMISEQAKAKVGYFDEESFGHGYGEENDYSLRVSREGLDNILCDNVYVIHQGNQSFKELNKKPDEQTMQRLLNKHPHYHHLIHTFINKDPLAGLRETIIDKIARHSKTLLNSLYD